MYSEGGGVFLLSGYNDTVERISASILNVLVEESGIDFDLINFLIRCVNHVRLRGYIFVYHSLSFTPQQASPTHHTQIHAANIKIKQAASQNEKKN